MPSAMRFPSSVRQTFGVQRCDIASAEQGEGTVDLLAQELDRARGSSLSACGSAVERRAPDQHRARAERERFHDVRAALKAAVDDHLDALSDGLDDLRQDL